MWRPDDLPRLEGSPLTAIADPVLAELWDNPMDAMYERS